MTALLHGVAPLPHLGVIRVLGDDAASFLHGQLTQDVSLLPPGQARLAAYCNAKGRMLASFVVLKLAPTELLLVCSRDILVSTLKRLSMFVLRAKARLSDVSQDWQVHGVAGESADALAGSAPAPWTAQAIGAAWAVELPPVESQRRLLWLAASAPAGPTLPAALWDWSEVRAGIATITQPVFEAFVPQMLNYESVGGVNFKKGCYPGQEIVARSQFRGTIKRRAFVVHAQGELAAGMEVFHESDPEQPVGLVAQAAPSPEGGWDAIASLQLSATTEGRLAAGSASGPALTLLPLPYLLLADL